MARSRMVRVDNEFAKALMRMRDEAQLVHGKKISGVYITRVISRDMRKKRIDFQ